MLVDGHTADLHLRHTIRPFADMQNTKAFPPQDRYTIRPLAGEAQPFLAVDADILRIGTGLDPDRVAGLCRIDRLLDGSILTRPIQGHDQGTGSRWRDAFL